MSDGLFLLGMGHLAYRRALPIEPFGPLTVVWLAGFAMLIGGLLIGSLGSPQPIRWINVAVQYLFAWLILPMLLLQRSREQLATMLKAFVWGVFAMNLLGSIVYFTYSGGFEEAQQQLGSGFLSGSRRLGAFASDANWNGAALAMAMPSVVFLRAKKLVGNTITFLWFAVLLLGVMLSASFSAFSSCVAGLVIFVLIGGIRPSAGMLGAIIAGTSLFALALVNNLVSLPAVFLARVGNAISNGNISEAGTYSGRMELMKEAWILIEQHMFIGMGADQYRVISSHKAPVHNIYLLLWAEGGLMSLVGWLLMIAIVIAVPLWAYSRDRIAAALTLSVSVTFLMASTASPHMYARFWSVPLILAL
ncbi:MAG: O-antigen ligase domain-containing protein, partial [Proteobacteria bacterium]